MISSVLTECVHALELDVSENHLVALVRFADEMKKWNKKVNLTAITADEDIAIKHLIDSIMVSGWIRGAGTVLDIGSGAGIPAIPLKILLPEVQIVSVDAVGKKVLFQRHVTRMLGLQGFDAVHARVETLRQSHAAHFDVIISRAFSSLDTFISLAAPLLKVGGRIIAMKGPAAEQEVHGGEYSFHGRAFHVTAVQSYSLPRNKGERCLVMVSAAESA